MASCRLAAYSIAAAVFAAAALTDGLDGYIARSRNSITTFGKLIGEWCDKNNMLFTGHLMEEDTLSCQVNKVGDCLRFYEHMQAPGIDLLTEYWRIYDTAKQVTGGNPDL